MLHKSNTFLKHEIPNVPRSLGIDVKIGSKGEMKVTEQVLISINIYVLLKTWTRIPLYDLVIIQIVLMQHFSYGETLRHTCFQASICTVICCNYLFCFWGTFHGKESKYLIDIIELNFTVLLLNSEALALPAEITSNESLSYLSRSDKFLHSPIWWINLRPFSTCCHYIIPRSFVPIKERW